MFIILRRQVLVGVVHIARHSHYNELSRNKVILLGTAITCTRMNSESAGDNQLTDKGQATGRIDRYSINRGFLVLAFL